MWQIRRLANHYTWLGHTLDRFAPALLPSAARLIFASTLLLFFWRSAGTKLGEGLTGLVLPSAGAYAQIFPKGFEASGYDTGAFGVLEWAIALTAAYGEFLIPLCLCLGLATRLAAFGMMVFIAVMSWVDIHGHGASPGVLFDGDPSGLIADQRLFWFLLLLILVMRGGGPLSLDRVVWRWAGRE